LDLSISYFKKDASEEKDEDYLSEPDVVDPKGSLKLLPEKPEDPIKEEGNNIPRSESVLKNTYKSTR